MKKYTDYQFSQPKTTSQWDSPWTAQNWTSWKRLSDPVIVPSRGHHRPRVGGAMIDHYYENKPRLSPPPAPCRWSE